MAAEKYELAAAYIAILPSLEGFGRSLQRQMSQQMNGASSSINRSFNSVAANFGMSLSRVMSGSANLFSNVVSRIAAPMQFAMGRAASTFGQTLHKGVNVAMGSLGVAVAAIGAEMVGGGLSRALDLNQAEAKLKAFGYTAQQMQSTMTAASNAIDGSAYTMNDSMTASTQFIAAGIDQQGELEAVLKNVGKLADMSGTSFRDMGNIMAKNAASGRIMWIDMLQLMNHGIPIQSMLAKQMGKTAAEIREMASAGKITFEMFDKAVTDINFDSALYAAKNVKLAFGNVRAQLRKIGAELWRPIIDHLGPTLVKVREGLVNLQKNQAFTDLVNLLQTKLAGAMQKADAVITKFVDSTSKVEKVKDTFARIGAKIKDLQSILKGFEGAAIGAGAALVSGFLSRIPVVGGMFGSISLGVGIFGGTLIQAYKDSDILQGSIKTLGDKLKNLFGTLEGGDGSFAKNLGDNISGIIDAISSSISTIDLSKLFGKVDVGNILKAVITNIADFINTIGTHSEEIGSILGGFFDTISNTLSGLSGDQSFGTWLAENVVKVFEFAVKALQVAVPIVAEIIKTLAGIATSDFIKGAIGWVIGVAKYITENELALKTFVGVLTALFVGSKVIGPVMAFAAFIKSFGAVGAAATAATAGGGLLASVTGFITGVSAASTALVAAAPVIFKGLAVVAGLVGAVALVSWLMDNLGGFDALNKLGEFLADGILMAVDTVMKAWEMLIQMLSRNAEAIANIITTLFQAIAPIADWFINTVVGVLSQGVDLFLQLINAMAANLNNFIAVSALAIKTIIESVTPLLQGLAEYGPAAGAGGLAAAGGIAALAGSLALLGGGSLLNDIASGLGSLWTGFTSAVTGTDTSPAAKILSLSDALKTIDGTIATMPATWETAGSSAYNAGFNIATQFSTGMEMGMATLESKMIAQIKQMVARMQAQVQATPIVMNMQASPIAAGIGMGSTYNSTTNYDVTVNNSSVLKSLVRASR